MVLSGWSVSFKRCPGWRYSGYLWIWLLVFSSAWGEGRLPLVGACEQAQGELLWWILQWTWMSGWKIVSWNVYGLGCFLDVWFPPNMIVQGCHDSGHGILTVTGRIGSIHSHTITSKSLYAQIKTKHSCYNWGLILGILHHRMIYLMGSQILKTEPPYRHESASWLQAANLKLLEENPNKIS